MMFFAAHTASPAPANAHLERHCDLHEAQRHSQPARRIAPVAVRVACGVLIGLSIFLDFAPSAWAGDTTAMTSTPAVPHSTPKPAQTISALPRAAAINGGLVMLDLSVLTTPAGEGPLYYQGNPVWVGRLSNDGPRVAVLGIGLDASGEQALTGTPTGEALLTFTVGAGDYPEQRLRIKEQKYVSPDPDQLARFSREAAEQKAAYRVFTTAAHADALWPTFQWPIDGRLSSPFGLKRFFNDEPRNPHMGIDIAAPKGAIARSPADGTVALVGDYFFNGRTAIIDHGQGLFSMLCHFDKVLVQAGQIVKAGDAVGEVGATGRATGPHVHWTVSLNDQRIDPRLLLPEAN